MLTAASPAAVRGVTASMIAQSVLGSQASVLPPDHTMLTALSQLTTLATMIPVLHAGPDRSVTLSGAKRTITITARSGAVIING